MLFVFSGNTTFIISGISNFECKMLKNLVKALLNSVSGQENLHFFHTFLVTYFTKTYAALRKSCSPYFTLQLSYWRFLSLVQNFEEHVVGSSIDRNQKHSSALWSTGARARATAPRPECQGREVAMRVLLPAPFFSTAMPSPRREATAAAYKNQSALTSRKAEHLSPLPLPPSRSSPSHSLPNRSTIPVPPLGPAGAICIAPSHSPAKRSPEQPLLRQPPPPVSATPARHRPSRPHLRPQNESW
jgi:hypothetical protein